MRRARSSCHGASWTTWIAMKLKESLDIFSLPSPTVTCASLSGVLTVLQTLGLFMTLLDAPFSSRAREAFGSLAGYLIQRRKSETSIAAHRTASKLTLSLQPEGLNDLLAFMERTLNLPLSLGPFNKVAGSLALIFLCH